jgi:hypothetical protein
VRRALAMLALAAGLFSSAQAQRVWQTEFGIQGGFSRLVQPGSGVDPLDAFGLPGFNIGPALPAPAGLFLVFPWKNSIAIETDIAASQLNSGGSATFLGLGLRGNYALGGGLYAAAGGALSYTNGVIANETQVGIQAAAGYRRRLARRLNGRLEIRTTFWGKAENAPPQNTYSVLIGVSTSSTGARAPSAPATGAGRAWRPALGVAGGYAHVHQIGGFDLVAVALPSYGGGLGTALAAPSLVLPPTIFAIIPIGRKLAIEPGLDIHRFQTGGTTDFSANLSARLDYAVHAGWYGALGGNLHYIKSSGADGAGQTGINMAWGYRFALTGPLGGRMEINYTMFGAKEGAGLPPVNALGLMFGVVAPLHE